jgi:hypothetical protein
MAGDRFPLLLSIKRAPEAPMTTRRNFIAASTLAASSLASLKALAQGGQEVEFLFVQSAKSLSFDKAANKVTLEGISPQTVFFSDRPDRIAGNMTTAAFVPFWSKGTDSFKSNPPNADISILEGKELRQVVAVLENPQLQGDNLTYTVKILQGDMPAKGNDVSVFIDIIGRPWTPMSFAGVARRSYRRAYYY